MIDIFRSKPRVDEELICKQFCILLVLKRISLTGHWHTFSSGRGGTISVIILPISHRDSPTRFLLFLSYLENMKTEVAIVTLYARIVVFMHLSLWVGVQGRGKASRRTADMYVNIRFQDICYAKGSKSD